MRSAYPFGFLRRLAGVEDRRHPSKAPVRVSTGIEAEAGEMGVRDRPEGTGPQRRNPIGLPMLQRPDMSSRWPFYASVAVLGCETVACFFAGFIELRDRGVMVGIDST